MIEGVEAVPTAMNIAVAQGTYLRGMKLALAETDRRYGGVRIEDEGLVDRMILAKDDPPKPTSSTVGAAVDRSSDPPTTLSASVGQLIPMADFLQFAERLSQQQAADGNWDEKTQRQAESISKLFVKFMVQDQRIHDLRLLTQEHVGRFVDFLRLDIYKHYGKSARDEQRTIEQLREKGRSVKQAKRGIDGDTLNRHLTFLGQDFDYAVARGVKNLEAIDLTKLRSKSRGKNKRARDERAKLPVDSAKAMFMTAPFSNCAGWDDMGKWGEKGGSQVFHCALYFVPILMLGVAANGRHWYVQMPLTLGEAQAARRYTDAVFGKHNASRGLRGDDPFDLYDWLLKANANVTQEQVGKFLEQNPTVAHYKGLSLKEARVRVAREYTKWAWMAASRTRLPRRGRPPP